MKCCPLLLLSFVLFSPALSAEDKSPAERSLEEYVRLAKAGFEVSQPSVGSLWRDGGENANLFRDFRARNIHDILIIRIVENTSALTTGGASGGDEQSRLAGFSELLGLERRVAELPGLLDGNNKSSFKGSGSISRGQVMNAMVAARVVDLLPNGNLVVQAVKGVKVDGEDMLLTISGVVRPRDISPANVVLSSAISDLQIRLTGKGFVRRQISPGLFFRLLRLFLPF